MKRFIIAFLAMILLFLLVFDYSYKQTMERGWRQVILNERFYHARVEGIVRRKDNGKVYQLNFLNTSGKYSCFEFDHGFDLYIQVGDFISKDSGELIIRVEKTNESKSFNFKPNHCDSSFVEMKDKLF